VPTVARVPMLSAVVVIAVSALPVEADSTPAGARSAIGGPIAVIGDSDAFTMVDHHRAGHLPFRARSSQHRSNLIWFSAPMIGVAACTTRGRDHARHGTYSG
jgi:hypothetical protein